MPTLDGLRRQIDTATDLSSIATTMKMLAAVSIYQYEQAVEALADYSQTIELGFHIALSGENFPIESADPTNRTAVIIFGSDQGMCGQFNEEIASYAANKVNEFATKQVCSVLAVGSRVEGQLLEAGWTVEHEYEVPTSVTRITEFVQEALPKIDLLKRETNFSRLLAFYNQRISASAYKPMMVQLLPIDPKRLRHWRDERWRSRSRPLFITQRRRLLSRLVQHHLFVSLFRACAESLASENASRIAAMQAAEKNIQAKIDELEIEFNNLRQTAITEELLDVVTGFEALSKPSGKRV